MIRLVIDLILLGLLLYHYFPLIRVCGNSMFPTYFDNEIIFGTRLFRKSKLKVGDVIVYKSPVEEDRVVIKRISNIMRDRKNLFFYCLGDNADQSYDSRYYGYVSSKRIVCKVINQRRNINHEHENNLCD